MGTDAPRRFQALDMNEPSSGNVRRLFPQRQLSTLDPFARLEELFMQPPAGLPPHEHRGFESVTHVLEGAFRYSDSKMLDLTAPAGAVQRFTAGRGIYHGERTGGDGQTRVLQVWIALRRADKELFPDVQQVEPGDVPETREGGVTRRVVVGEGSPVALHTEVGWLDLTLTRRRATCTERLPAGHRALVYVMEGHLAVDGAPLEATEALVYEPADGERQLAIGGRKGAHAALIHGRPHGEPIRAWGGMVD